MAATECAQHSASISEKAECPTSSPGSSTAETEEQSTVLRTKEKKTDRKKAQEETEHADRGHDDDADEDEDGEGVRSGKKLRFAMVCASNMNRSMQAHHVLKQNGFLVESYGTSSTVKLPGKAIDKPNIYRFGKRYSKIKQDLKAKDANLYRKNGVLQILSRNEKIKEAPERWQDELGKQFDVVIAFEDRVYDSILEDLQSREPSSYAAVHIINLPVRDTHAEATVGGSDCLDFCNAIVNAGESWEEEIDTIVDDFYQRTGRRMLHTTLFY